jgi:hypothetical protein
MNVLPIVTLSRSPLKGWRSQRADNHAGRRRGKGEAR